MSLVQEFSIGVARDAGRVVFTVRGELDAATAPRLHAALDDLADRDRDGDLVVDMGGLTFIDSSGIYVLIQALKPEPGPGPDAERDEPGRLQGPRHLRAHQRVRLPVPGCPDGPARTGTAGRGRATMALMWTLRGEWSAEDWRRRAACRQSDPDLFFPVGATGPAVEHIEAARAVCRNCPVQADCLEFALASNQEAGIWGGATEEERAKLRRARRDVARSVERLGLRPLSLQDGKDRRTLSADEAGTGPRSEALSIPVESCQPPPVMLRAAPAPDACRDLDSPAPCR